MMKYKNVRFMKSDGFFVVPFYLEIRLEESYPHNIFRAFENF